MASNEPLGHYSITQSTAVSHLLLGFSIDGRLSQFLKTLCTRNPCFLECIRVPQLFGRLLEIRHVEWTLHYVEKLIFFEACKFKALEISFGVEIGNFSQKKLYFLNWIHLCSDSTMWVFIIWLCVLSIRCYYSGFFVDTVDVGSCIPKLPINKKKKDTQKRRQSFQRSEEKVQLEEKHWKLHKMYKSGVDHFCQLGFWLNGVCKKRRPYFIVHFISRVSIEYGRMLLSMMMIMCAVHRSQCCMSWCSVYSSASADRKMITSLRLTLLFSVATQMHASLFLRLHCIQRGVYPPLYLLFKKLEFLGPLWMHWMDNTWPYFIIWWLGSFLQKTDYTC